MGKLSRKVTIIYWWITVCLLTAWFSYDALADRTYLAGEGNEADQELYSGPVDVNVAYGLHEGTVTGCISGDLNAKYVVFGFEDPVNNGYYRFEMGTYEIFSGAKTYTGYYTSTTPPDGTRYLALYGDIGAVGSEDEFELTSIYGTQLSGHFSHEAISNGYNEYDTTLPLVIDDTTITGIPLSGYHSGNLQASGRSFDLSLDNIDWSQIGLPLDIDELEAFVGEYDWDQTTGGDGKAYLLEDLGHISGSLAGVFREEDNESFIEHCGTAPPVPIPPAIWLLAPGLGILVIRTRKKKTDR